MKVYQYRICGLQDNVKGYTETSYYFNDIGQAAKACLDRIGEVGACDYSLLGLEDNTFDIEVSGVILVLECRQASNLGFLLPKLYPLSYYSNNILTSTWNRPQPE